MLTFQAHQKATDEDLIYIPDLKQPAIEEFVGKKDADALREDMELIMGVYESFDKDAYLKGQLAPVFLEAP